MELSKNIKVFLELRQMLKILEYAKRWLSISGTPDQCYLLVRFRYKSKEGLAQHFYSCS